MSTPDHHGRSFDIEIKSGMVRIEIDYRRLDEVQSCGSYLSQNDFRLRFGLGLAREAIVLIRWLDGRVEEISSVRANQVVTTDWW